MKNNFLLALLVALVFVSCSKEETLVPVGASSPQNESGVLNKKEGYKEIAGTLTYNRATDFDINCGDHWTEGYFNDGSYLGQGELDGLGKTTSKTKAWVNMIYVSGNPYPVGVHVGYQCCSFFANSGDELFLTTDGYDLYFNSQGVATGECKFYFAGGTGKYKDASGSFTGYVENPLNGSFTVKLEGKLSY